MERYKTEIRYYEFETSSDRLRIPIRIRERHLTQDSLQVEHQLIGDSLQLYVPSGRDSIAIRVPTQEWEITDVKRGTFTGRNNCMVTIGRYENNVQRYASEDGEKKYVECDILVVE